METVLNFFPVCFSGGSLQEVRRTGVWTLTSSLQSLVPKFLETICAAASISSNSLYCLLVWPTEMSLGEAL